MILKPAGISRLVAPLALCLISGCTTVNTIEPAHPTAQRHLIDDKRIITDASLNRRVNATLVNVSKAPGGEKRLEINVFNRSRYPQRFFYTVEWFDGQGMLLTTTTTRWVEREILGKETLSLTAMAPNPKCDDFRVKFVENY